MNYQFDIVPYGMPDIMKGTLLAFIFLVISFCKQICFQFSFECVNCFAFFDTIGKSIPKF